MEDFLLRASLQVAVPIAIEEMRHLDHVERTRVAAEAVDVIASKGDIILYRSPKKGETAKAFAALARALAVLSFAPGGVKFLGDVWATDQDDVEPRPAPRTVETVAEL